MVHSFAVCCSPHPPSPTLSIAVMKLKQHALTLIALTFTAVVLEANPNDLNQDKRISWQEFEAFQKQEAKKNGRKFDPQQAKYLFEDKDRDGNGFLSYKEFASNHVDLDGDKFISFDEYVKEMKKRGARNGRVPTDTWLKETYAKKDTDGDGRLTYQEMAKPVQL